MLLKEGSTPIKKDEEISGVGSESRVPLEGWVLTESCSLREKRG